MMESMLRMVDGRRQEKENVPLAALVEDVFACLCRDFGKDGITVEIKISENLTVWAVPIQIQHVIMNLILNARHAMLPRGGVLTIRASEAADVTHIEVADTGSGIEPADLPRIFESFFTTKREKASSSGYSGCGLGLAFCKKIIDAHHGCISVESQPNQGSKFRITLPRPQ
jgi:two-component system sensor histidine kinase BaeS